ncbi:MAG: hypothetical protein WC655_04430 [Candidatus Hydrogenedentales bacterium]|jgi:lysozyme family protein
MARSIDIEYYADKWLSMELLPEWQPEISLAVRLVKENDNLYAEASRRTGIPKWFFGPLHYREGSCKPNRQILNGEDFQKKTTIVPIGLGPFADWAQAAEIAAEQGEWKKCATWSIAGALQFYEKHNGYGYRNMGLDSPYVFRGSTHCLDVGKFVADHKYDPNAKDKQLGCACILKGMFPER